MRDRGPDRRPPVRHLSQKEVAARLGVSPRTLEGWRYRGRGPAFLKLEGKVVYRLSDVERFEAGCLRRRRAPGRIRRR